MTPGRSTAARSFVPTIAAIATITTMTMVASVAGCVSGAPATGARPHRIAPPGGWNSTVEREHPLVGRIVDVATDERLSWGEFVSAAAGADLVLLGEQHDNADHHGLQMALLSELVRAGRRPVVAFEQIDVDRQDALDRALADAGGQGPAERADAVAAAVEWAKTGWPPFDQYRGVFETAIAAGLPLRAANLSRAALKNPEPLQDEPAVGVSLDAAGLESLKAEIEDSHCGYANESMVEAMVRAQLRRDATMSSVLAAAAGQAEGPVAAVLICGFGHARRDYGLPLHLHARIPGKRVLSVAFVEVLSGVLEPADYASTLHAARLPFDYMVFTPRADDEDPCEKFRASLEKMGTGTVPDPESGAGPASPMAESEG